MKKTILLGMMSALLISAPSWAAGPSYIAPTVLAAQEALARLGYDVGTPDGRWGPKSNKAMNDLRSANGLPPETGFAGSSLALVHRLSPGDDTLPHPGLLITDVKARRAELAATAEIVKSQCRSVVGQGTMISFAKPIATIDNPETRNGFVSGDDDWYSAHMDTFLGAESDCLAGNDRTCKAIVDYTLKSAQSDAFKPVHTPTGEANEGEKWVANILLRDLIIAYGVARQFTPLAATDEAIVLDWLKARVDVYHNIIPSSDNVIGNRHSPKHSNHGLAHMLPALAFGVLVGDRAMLEPALEDYLEILAGERDDGSIPTETRRGSAWFHYSNIQIGQLLAVAQLAAAQGINANEEIADPGHSIAHAVKFTLDGLEDFDVARTYAKVNEAPTFGPGSEPPRISGLQISWLPSYIALFGEDDNVERMRTMTIDPEVCSPESLDKDKLETSAAAICGIRKGGPIPFSDLFLLSDLRPSGHVGYAVGCMLATSDWRGILSPKP